MQNEDWFQIYKRHVARWEGLRLKAYKDVAGVWTIGYGHTGPDVYQGKTITQEEADALLAQDTKEAHDAVLEKITRPMNPYQEAMFTSLTYNIGNGGFKSSTAARRFNAGDILGAAEALTWWNKATVNGKLVVVDGLVNRRESERETFLKEWHDTTADPIEQPEKFPSKAKGGEHKKLTDSKTLQGAATAAAASAPVIASLQDLHPVVAISVLVLIAAIAFIAFNRIKEWKEGEH